VSAPARQKAAAARHQVLLVDDDPNILTTIGMRLEAMGYGVLTAADGVAAVEAARRERPDLLLLDLRLPRMDGLDVLTQVKEARPDVEVILLTAQSSVESAVAAMKGGAFDYLEKPIDSQRLGVVLQQALTRRGYRQEVSRLKDTLKEMGRFGHMIGQSDPMRHLYGLIDQVAATTATVLVTGESGTGKELVARTIHDMSDRAEGPFVAVNCSAIMASLWESETFGYERGAFTGAHRQHLGYIEQAHGGTLFLDEVGEMSKESQAKFLRVLETHRLKRVGGRGEIAVDLRVVAATNRDLEAAVRDGRFRKDLYYRLAVFTLHAPPLRERRSDIPLLARTFAAQFAEAYDKPVDGIAEPALDRLKAHDWPGNVRELRNVIERAIILAQEKEIAERHLPPQMARQEASTAAPGGASFPDGATIQSMERALILATLEKTDGNKTRAARQLGISLKTLHNKLARYRKEGTAGGGESAGGDGG
jgi:DNA-binding NtrC family response regulator